MQDIIEKIILVCSESAHPAWKEYETQCLYSYLKYRLNSLHKFSTYQCYFNVTTVPLHPRDESKNRWVFRCLQLWGLEFQSLLDLTKAWWSCTTFASWIASNIYFVKELDDFKYRFYLFRSESESAVQVSRVFGCCWTGLVK